MLGVLADVTTSASNPQPAFTASLFVTSGMTVLGSVLNTAWYDTKQTGTFNLDFTDQPASTSAIGVPGQMQIDPVHNLMWFASAGDTWKAYAIFPSTGFGTATVMDYSASSAVTDALGTGVTSATCVTAPCTTARGNFTVVGGSATTGTILTLGFTDAPTSTLTCSVKQEGGTARLGISASISGSTMMVNAANSIAGQTFEVSWLCAQ
jgi:hypothetical protein